jgi:D-alanyl-D-alanine carboxypeptidase
MSDFPEHYHYFGVTQARFGGLSIRNHNRMLDSYEGVDGIKTGYIRDSGFNIVTSASRGGHRVVGAVFGGSSWVERDAHMASLLDEGFSRLGVAVARGERAAPMLVRQAEAAPLPRNARAAQLRQARAEPRMPARSASRATTSRAVAARPAATTRSGAAAARAPAPVAARPAIARGTQQAAPRQATKGSASRPATAVAPRAPTPMPPPQGRIRTAELR